VVADIDEVIVKSRIAFLQAKFATPSAVGCNSLYAISPVGIFSENGQPSSEKEFKELGFPWTDAPDEANNLR
jgi:hypothetical protein